MTFTPVEQVSTDEVALNAGATAMNSAHSALGNGNNTVKRILQTGEADLIKAAGVAKLWVAGQTPTTPTDPTPTPPITSSTPALQVPAGYSASDLFVDDKFTKLDTSLWTPSMGSGQFGIWGVGKNGDSTAGPPYNAAYFSPSQLAFGPGGLKINAVRDTSINNYNFVSGCLASYRIWALKKGYVQWLVWFPDMSTGAWPGLWLLDGTTSGHDSNPNSENDAFEGGYTNSPSRNPNLAWTSDSHGAGNKQVLSDAPSALPGAWHVVGADFQPGQHFATYLDGKQMAYFTQNITTDPLEVITNLQMAQSTQGWHSVVGNATPALVELQVAELQVYGEAA